MTELTLAAGADAFGDGTHPTTRGVMELLAGIDPAAFQPTQALDVGTGSGILAMAIAQQFGCPVLATDIATSAVEAVRANATSNGIPTIIPLRANGFDHPEIRARAPYDLIVMNILAEPLVALAQTAASHLASPGLLIVSGVLEWQGPTVREAYTAVGLECTARVAIGGWVALAFQSTG